MQYFICARARARVCACVRARARVCACACACARVRVRVRVRVCIYIYICFFILAPLKLRVTYRSTDFILPSFWSYDFSDCSWLVVGILKGKSECVLKVLYPGKHVKEPLMTTDHEI
jgi:hypothetical protein